MSKKRIDERIDEALNGGTLCYHELARRVFPEKDYPRAWKYSSNGGPPGCYMALSAALRRYKFPRRSYDAWQRRVNQVMPRNDVHQREDK